MKLEVKIHTYKKVPRTAKIPRTHRIENSLFSRRSRGKRGSNGKERKREREGKKWINQPCVETITRTGEPGHQDRNAPRWSVSREEVQEAGSPFNLAPLGGRRNGSNTVRPLIRRRTHAGCETFFFIHHCPPKGLNHACAHVLKENRSRSVHSRGRLLPLLTSCPSTRGEWIQKFPSVGKVGESGFEWRSRWIGENRDIIQRSIFLEPRREIDTLDPWFEQGGGFLMWME